MRVNRTFERWTGFARADLLGTRKLQDLLTAQFGAGSAVSLYTCTAWHAERTPLPERDAEGSDPILVVGNTGDPVTPIAGAEDLAEQLDSGVLLIWQGNGHTAYPKTDCITTAVNAYLIDLTPPNDGLTCPA